MSALDHKAKLPAYLCSVSMVPLVSTHALPFTAVAMPHLETAFCAGSGTIYQAYISDPMFLSCDTWMRW